MPKDNKFTEYEIVRIITDKSEKLIGQECIVAGMWKGYKKPYRNKWFYDVTFLNREAVDSFGSRFEEYQLETTGKHMTKQEYFKKFYGEPTYIKVQVNTDTGESWVTEEEN